MIDRFLLAALLPLVPLSAAAADRVQAGEWVTTLHIMGRDVSRSACITQADANAINGDATAIKGYAEKASAGGGCQVKDVKVNGNQVVIRSVCATGGESIGTTTYHGDRSETENTNGARAESKRIGPCK